MATGTKKKPVTKSNPRGFQTLGDVVQVRYRRTIGKHKGNFKHDFKPENGVVKVGYLNGKKVIIIEPK